MVGLGVLLNALLVAVSPLLHHDLDCHLKTPAHCGACTQGPGASRLEAGFSLDEPVFSDLGGVEPRDVLLPTLGATQERIGRAPPA
jgi:hypothetical protein